MSRIALYLLAQSLLPSASLPPATRPYRLIIDWELRLRSHAVLEIDPRGVDAPRELELLPVLLGSIDDIVFSTTDWIGVSLSDRVAVLVDVRISGYATSPDPARPDARGAVVARLGVEWRTE